MITSPISCIDTTHYLFALLCSSLFLYWTSALGCTVTKSNKHINPKERILLGFSPSPPPQFQNRLPLHSYLTNQIGTWQRETNDIKLTGAFCTGTGLFRTHLLPFCTRNCQPALNKLIRVGNANYGFQPLLQVSSNGINLQRYNWANILTVLPLISLRVTGDRMWKQREGGKHSLN